MRPRSSATAIAGCGLRAAARLVLLAAVAVARVAPAAGDDDDGDDGGRATPFGVVVLDASARRLAAIEVSEVAPSRVARRWPAGALVMDMAAVLPERLRWAEARARLQGIDARRAAVAARLKRLGADPEATSRRELEALRAEADALAAERRGAAAAAQSARAALVLAWGDVLAGRLLAPRATDADGLLGGHRRVLMVTLPTPLAGRTPAAIEVERPGGGTVAATVLGPAPRSDPLTGAGTVWAVVGEWARIGQRLRAWLADPDTFVAGYPLPRSALVYREGAAWVYVEGPAGTFLRRRVLSAAPTPSGVMVRLPGSGPQRVVVRGAQTLLSEELRWNIPDEDELD